VLLPFAAFTYPGTIESSDCESVNGRYDSYRVLAPQPCLITLRATTQSFDPLLEVQRATTGERLALDDNSGAGAFGTDARLLLESCTAPGAPIDIIATASPASPTASGSYQLLIQIEGGVSLFAVGPPARARVTISR
jgi:hypothetical protein